MAAAIEPNTRDTLDVVHGPRVDWIPWAFEGAYFKLLHADRESGRFTILIKVDPGVSAPIHRHLEPVEAYVTKGGFHYADDPAIRFEEGSYLFENVGAIHEPVSPEGAEMLALFHGPVEGVAETGEMAGRFDAGWHMDAWRAAGNDVPGG